MTPTTEPRTATFTEETLALALYGWVKRRDDDCGGDEPCEHDRNLARSLMHPIADWVSAAHDHDCTALADGLAASERTDL